WIMDTYSMMHGHSVPAVVTGKPVTIGGSSGRYEATGRGVMFVTQEACKYAGVPLEGATVAVQGFGNVGSVASKLLRDTGAKIVAVSNASGGIHDEAGMDIDALIAMPRDRASLPSDAPGRRITNAELLELPVDILIPAATDGQIHAANAVNIRAKMIIEAANGPTTAEGDRILRERNIYVVPDIVANSGGVIVSYFEWVQDLQSFFWEEAEVNSRLERIIKRSFQEVAALQAKESISMREAAYVLAVTRVVEATTVRGIFP
ncbi:MAG: Glu/Leu/Phe/Val family dehydrogenase, partial [Gammaproteobacteria bacterium]